MSSQVFPSLPGLDVKVRRSLMHRVTTQETASGQELRVRRWSGPKYRYEVRFNGLRQAIGNATTDEVATLADFIAAHGGGWDSFLFTDPMDGVQRRVRVDDEDVEFERSVRGVWAVGSLTLVTTSVDYQAGAGTGVGNAASGVILPAPDASAWLMSIDDAGGLYTGKLVPVVAGGQVAADVVLVATGGSRWRLTVTNFGALTTASDATQIATTTLALKSPNATDWSVTVDVDGALVTTEV